jgi:hypothetical protein
MTAPIWTTFVCSQLGLRARGAADGFSFSVCRNLVLLILWRDWHVHTRMNTAKPGRRQAWAEDEQKHPPGPDA